MLRVVVVAGVHLRRSGGTYFGLCPVWYRLGLTSGWPPQSPATFFIVGGQQPGSDGDMVLNQALSDLRKEFVDHGDEITK